jgi:hypothetical protein
MFAEAYPKASCFTHPVIMSLRFLDGTVESSVGSFVILNSDGWVATTTHVRNTFSVIMCHMKERAAHRERAVAIQQDPRLSPEQKRRRIARLKANPRWITHHSVWWGRNGVRIQEAKVLPEADLAILRLEPFDPMAVSVYPTLKNPSNLLPGTSLCRLGFPFHDVDTTFDEETRQFVFPVGTVPPPRLPIEGIYTRDVVAGRSGDERYEIKFLETSSPGLKGQSGGPIFDAKGTVWAIQSRTSHYPLGFSPKVKKDGEEVEESQFLNVGWGVHPQVLVAFLKDSGIAFEVSGY